MESVNRESKLSKKDKKKIIKIVVLIIALIIFMLIAINIFFVRIWNPLSSHEFDIDYNFQNSNESEAINISEQLDYQQILDMPRYYQPTGEFPNFIDKTVIDDYIEEYKNTNENFDKWFKYRTEAIQIENSTIRYFIEYKSVEIYWEDSETGEWRHRIEYEPRYRIEVNIGSEIIYRYNREIYEHYDPIIAWNSSGNYVFLDNNQNYSISNLSGFVVVMSLSYGYVGGPLYGWGIDNNQIIILDLNYNPAYVIQIERSYWVS